MSQLDEFRALIVKVRAGNEEAAIDVVRSFEPMIRREIRLRLEDQSLRRVFDSTDVTQSVFASFFLRVAAGEYDLEHPDQLVRLLIQMARNKLASASRKQYRHCRDTRKTERSDITLDRIAVDELSPGEQLAHEELLQAVRREMTCEELELAELRAEGLSWDAIAIRLGGSAHARRMQLTRGAERAGKKLRIQELL